MSRQRMGANFVYHAVKERAGEEAFVAIAYTGEALPFLSFVDSHSRSTFDDTSRDFPGCGRRLWNGNVKVHRLKRSGGDDCDSRKSGECSTLADAPQVKIVPCQHANLYSVKYSNNSELELAPKCSWIHPRPDHIRQISPVHVAEHSS